MKKRETHRQAFTLVELLVVIGIIALLISVLLPSLNKARQTAVTLQCASNLRAIGQAITMYQNSNGGWNPDSLKDTSCWQIAASKLMGVPSQLRYDSGYYSVGNNAWLRKSVFNCPATVLERKNPWTPSSSYMGHPLYFGGDIPKAWGWPLVSAKPVGWKFSYKGGWLKNPAEKIIAGDGTQLVLYEPGQGLPVFLHVGKTSSAQGGTLYGGTRMCEEPELWDNPAFDSGGHPNMKNSLNEDLGYENITLRARHGNRTINLLYGDGHVVGTSISTSGGTELKYRDFAIPASRIISQ